MVGLSAALLAACAVALRIGLRDQLEPRAALALLRSVQHFWWAAPAFFGAYVVLTSLFVPATVFHMVLGAAYGFRIAVAVNLVAFNVTSNLHFLLARRVGREKVSQWLGGMRLRGVEERLAREGIRAAMLVRVLPLPNMAVNVTAGLSPIRWRDFAIGSAIGAVPVVVVYTYFAAALVEGVAEAKEKALVQTLIGAAAIVALALGSRLLQAITEARARAR